MSPCLLIYVHMHVCMSLYRHGPEVLCTCLEWHSHLCVRSIFSCPSSPWGRILFWGAPWTGRLGVQKRRTQGSSQLILSVKAQLGRSWCSMACSLWEVIAAHRALHRPKCSTEGVEAESRGRGSRRQADSEMPPVCSDA